MKNTNAEIDFEIEESKKDMQEEREKGYWSRIKISKAVFHTVINNNESV